MQEQDLNDLDLDALLELSAAVDAALSQTTSMGPDVEVVTKPKKRAAAKPKTKLSEPALKQEQGKRGWAPARYELVMDAQSSSIKTLTDDLMFVADVVAQALGVESCVALAAITNRTLSITTEEV